MGTLCVGLGFVFREMPALSLSKHGAVSSNMQEIHKEKVNFSIKSITELPGLTCYLPLFLPFLSRTHIHSPVVSVIAADPKTLWPGEWGKQTAQTCACLKATFQSRGPSHRLREGVVTLPNA